ncbi:uncharacterized protein METZ01_LOCUS227408 [marine metagenome]|uniref:Uncharacterized protein n=1 Tax=marine metagenome TaxID=408172 RepID=A0A382GIK4_9ZZZZ
MRNSNQMFRVSEFADDLSTAWKQRNYPFIHITPLKIQAESAQYLMKIQILTFLKKRQFCDI